MERNAPAAWLFRFSATFVALTALAVALTASLPDYRNPAHNFYAMPHGEYFAVDGLTRRQSGGLKLGFAETYPAPPIAAFGNHIIRYFGADAFGEPEDAELFFNYWYENLSLPELLRYIRHIEARGHLPSQLMIVSITPPNADNGHYIIDHGNELPPDVFVGDSLAAPDGDLVGVGLDAVEADLHEVFNYNTLLLGLSQGVARQRETGPARCSEGSSTGLPNWLDRFNWRLRGLLGPDYCSSRQWAWTIRRDGSMFPPDAAPVPNLDPLDDRDRGLHAGDEREIARYLQAIDAIGARHGTRVVFLITPVFETERGGSVVNQIMDRALRLTPNLEVVDDRSMHSDRALFINSLHPGPIYFRLLAAELRRRGFLSPATNSQRGVAGRD